MNSDKKNSKKKNAGGWSKPLDPNYSAVPTSKISNSGSKKPKRNIKTPSSRSTGSGSSSNRKPASGRPKIKKYSSDRVKAENADKIKQAKKAEQVKKAKFKLGDKEVEYDKPPKTLLLIWILTVAELILDLVTSAIAFAAFLATPEPCCGSPINNGAGPLGTTIPFFFLIIAELIFLLRTIMMTLWPSYFVADDKADTNDFVDEDGVKQKSLKDRLCCCFKWNPKYLMWLVNVLTVINPFFGFFIAWQLMYQSDKTEALTVMVLEFITIILHFVSVKLEKGAETWPLKLMHGIIIIPWLATLSINVWYLNQGGVCYDTKMETFWYKGCEICSDGSQPVNVTEVQGHCPISNEFGRTTMTIFEELYLWDLDSETNCDATVPVCWFPY